MTKGASRTKVALRVVVFLALLFALGHFFLSSHVPSQVVAPPHESSLLQAWRDAAARLRARSFYHEWKGSSSEWMKRSPIGRFLFLFYDEGSIPTAAPREALQAIARDSTKLPFNVVPVANASFFDEFSNVLPEDFAESYAPALVIFDVAEGFKRYLVRLDPEWLRQADADELKLKIETELLNPYLNHSLKPFLRSQQPEQLEYEQENAVRPLTGHQFEYITSKKTQVEEFFVIFYAPWCGHCRRVQEALEVWARRSSSVLTVYKLDATRNDVDHPALRITRVPQVYFFSPYAGYSHPTAMSHKLEDLDTEKVREFLVEHSKLGVRWRNDKSLMLDGDEL